MSFVIPRNGWYTETCAASIPSAVKNGAFIGCTGGGRISSVARADYAEAAVRVLAADGYAGRTYELAGNIAYTLSELAAEVSHQTCKTIVYKVLLASEYASILAAAGVAQPLAENCLPGAGCFAVFLLIQRRRCLNHKTRVLSGPGKVNGLNFKLPGRSVERDFDKLDVSRCVLSVVVSLNDCGTITTDQPVEGSLKCRRSWMSTLRTRQRLSAS